jgi:peptide/nickel transport system ATP-binding protein
VPDPRLRRGGSRIRLTGEVADPARPPPGCPFHPRCRYAADLCRSEPPPLREIAPGHRAACHFADTLPLKGVVAKAA